MIEGGSLRVQGQPTPLAYLELLVELKPETLERAAVRWQRESQSG